MDSLIVAQAGETAASQSSIPQTGDQFAAQIVPTEVIPLNVEGRYLIRATVVFTPVPKFTTPSPGGINALDRWPEWIADQFEKNEILVRMRPAMGRDGSQSPETLGAVNRFASGYDKLGGREIALGRLTGIWQDWFSNMPALRRLLYDSSTATANELDLFQRKMPVQGVATSTPDVISVPRADLARRFVFERARGLIETIACTHSPTDADAIASKRAAGTTSARSPEGAILPKLHVGVERVRTIKSFLGEEWKKQSAGTLSLASDLLSSPPQIAAEAIEPLPTDLAQWRAELKQLVLGLTKGFGAKDYMPFQYELDRPQGNDGKWFNELENHLRDERCWAELVLGVELKDQREAARKHTEACMDCADACSDGDVNPTEYLARVRAQRQGYAASHAEQIATAVMDGTGNAAAAKDAAAQSASTQPDYGVGAPDPYLGPQLRWQALQSTPALMRALHLAIDIEFEVKANDLIEVAGAVSGKGCFEGEARFIEFAIDGTSTDLLQSSHLVQQRLWTLTKLRLPVNGVPGHCWPATTEEWALYADFATRSAGGAADCPVPEDTGFVDQFEAVYDLDASLKVGEQTLRRYDVFSLDVTIAAEAARKRQTVEDQIKEVGPTVPAEDKVLPDDERKGAIEYSTLKTAGLQIVDRWRQAAVIDEIVTSCRAAPGLDRRLDANDLAIGYRLDVGVLTGRDKREWTSLSERLISYVHGNDPDAVDDLNDIVDAFSPPQDESGVRQVDAATLAMGTRIVTNSQGGVSDGGNQTAFADQMLAAWDGDPIGVRTGSFEGFTSEIDLPVSRKLYLATGGEERAHRLRFGGSYAIGARSVLVGGVCAPLTRTKALYDRGLGRGMAYPSMSELQRYLRQERVGPPIVAIEEELLLGEFRSERKGIDGKEMVVRSPPDEAAAKEPTSWRFQPGETTRMVFAPLVDLDFAVMHSVFDDIASDLDAKPPGGLQDIDYDSDWGGFPLFDPKEPPQAGAVRGQYRPYEKVDENGEKRRQKINPGGFAVFRKRLGAGPRDQEYYPDPAARDLIIALRYPDQPDRYLSGPAIRIPLYKTGPDDLAPATPGYPHARPIRIRVKAVNSAGVRQLATYDDLESRAVEAGVALTALKTEENGLSIMTVTLCLNPGEDFEVETWCIPAEKHLRAWFDLPEAIALIMNCAADNKAVQCCQAVAAAPTSDSNADIRLRRGEASIPWSAVCDAASAAFTTMLSRPLPDIASTRRLRAIHAAGQPKEKPAGDEIRLLRLLPANRNEWLKPAGLGVYKDDDGGSQIIVLGKATFDPDTTETLELRAVAPTPLGGALDNPELGRSYEKRARGIWPQTQATADGQQEPSKASQRRATAPGELTYMDELFGFDVARDGKVEPRRGEGLVARWQIDRKLKLTDGFADLADLTRLPQVIDRAGDTSKSARSALEGIFPDTLARRVTLRLAAASRTARQIPDRPSYPTPAEAAVDQSRLFKASEPFEIILPATDRPAALTPKSLLPSYVWSTEGKIRSRKAKVRIRLQRPWWTSGEDERLGVVVWPPNLMAATGIVAEEWQNSELEQGIVERKTPMGKKEGPREIDLHRFAENREAPWREGFFTDADLGSGGAYVTRWGADPIFASEEMAWLIDAAAFRDISTSKGDFAEPIDLIKTEHDDLYGLWPKDLCYKPRFVENALMPIPDADDRDAADNGTKENGKGEAKKNETDPTKPALTPEFMLVSLVTYAPRFDPDFEHWYVDVDLDVGQARDPFIRFGLVRFQPFAKRHLQVSQPVAEWVQVVGYLRDVTVAREPRNGRDWISVCVGPTMGVDAAKEFEPQGPGTSPGETPLMRVTLIECTRSPHGQIFERVARLDRADMESDAFAGRIDEGTDGFIIKTSQANAGAALLLDTLLPIPASGDAQGVHYAVLVEELTKTRRSTYSNEPIRKDADILEGERYIESGARFAVRVELDPQNPPADE